MPFKYGAITLYGWLFQAILLNILTFINWALSLSLATTWEISVDFFSSGYLDISVLRVCFQQLCIHCRIPIARWVSPFGHCGINACCQLPRTFRRLPRPSSPLTAKASTVCAYSLDHITPSRLRVVCVRGYKAQTRIQRLNYKVPFGTRLSLTTRHGHSSQNARYFPSFQRTRSGLNAVPLQFLMCAQSSFVREWWVWEDSNHRPHPYQGCALTT